MASRKAKVYVGAMTYGEGDTSTLEIPRNHCIASLKFLLIASITRASGTAGSVKDSAPAQLVSDIELQLNGTKTLKRMPFARLHRMCQVRHHNRPWIYAPNLPGFGALTGDINKVAAQFDFERPRNEPNVRAVDTLLDPRGAGITALDLKVTWANGEEILNDAGNATVTIVSAKIHVWADLRIGSATENRPLWKESMTRHPITAAGESDLALPVNTRYDMLALFCEQDGDLADTMLPFGLANTNAVELYSGTEVFHRCPAGLMLADQRLDFELDEPERIDSGAAIDHSNQVLNPAGLYILNFTHGGSLLEALDATGLPDLKLRCNWAVPGTLHYVDIVKSEIILPVLQS